MASKGYIKRKRKLIGPTIGIMGFIFRHCVEECVGWSSDGKTKESKSWAMDLNLAFVWSGAYVNIHSNSDVVDKSFDAYHAKLLKIKDMCERSLNHLNTGKGPFVARDFLNDEKINDGYGATLFITCDPSDGNNYCIFEISSCYKKYRYGTTPKGMKYYLKELLAFMDVIFKDLEIVKAKIEEVKVDDQRLLQSGGKTESSDS